MNKQQTRTKIEIRELPSAIMKIVPAVLISLLVIALVPLTASAASVTTTYLPATSYTDMGGGLLQDPGSSTADWTSSSGSDFGEIIVYEYDVSSTICSQAIIENVSVLISNASFSGGYDQYTTDHGEEDGIAGILVFYDVFGTPTQLTTNSVQDGYDFGWVAPNTIGRGKIDGTPNGPIVDGAIQGLFDAGSLAYTSLDFQVLVQHSYAETVNGNNLGVGTLTTSAPLIAVTYDNSACPNTPPTTDPDTASTTPGKAVTITILSNDSDSDGDTLSVTKIDNQDITSGQTITLSNGSGTVTLNDDGTITFIPEDGYTGTSTFTYTISDGRGGTQDGSVTIEVTSTATASATLADTGDSLPIFLISITTLGLLATVSLAFSRKN